MKKNVAFSSALMAAALFVLFSASRAQMKAGQSAETVRVDADDIGGVVTGPEKTRKPACG